MSSPPRTVLVTGAASGLGKVMATALLRQGHRVVLSSTNAITLAKAIDESGAQPGQAIAVVSDLGNDGACESLIEQALSAFGPIDMLVNNAGLGSDSIRAGYIHDPFRFWEVDAAIFERFFKVNSTAPYRLASILAPGMITNGWGRIVNVTTSLDTMLKVPVYGGSKAAIEAHTAVMANDLEGTGVTANVLVPGGVAVSRMTATLGLPLDQMIPAEVMSAPISWLCSNASDDFSGRRMVACQWDSALPAAQAAKASSYPVAWTGYGVQRRSADN
jgi:3-oxoacyl-[acyl-carrier protein] reductase